MSHTPMDPSDDEDDLAFYYGDDQGPSFRSHASSSSSAKADPDVLAPVVNPFEANKKVVYYHAPTIGTFSYGYGHPMKPFRMRMAHSIITSYGLDTCMSVREPKEADKVDMTRFHTDEYVDFLERVTPENGQALTGQSARFLVGDDCPPFPSVYQFCSLSSGGSISAANSINSGAADIAINWAGGLHHAKKREASGFCYTNDIVLGILELLRIHPRVLYIDIDIHHGDGVEEAFYSTNRVLTLSFHKFGDFFPGSGDVRDMGIGEGKGYAVNVPLRDGVDDDSYQRKLFRPVIQHIMDWYRPGAVVLQCGADSLAGDKLGCFNLSMRGHAACVSFMQSFNVPLICVGGGGYTVRNVARTWAYETALILGREPEEDLPFNEYMNWFGPEYKLDVRPTSMENLNSDAYLEGLMSRIVDNLKSLPFAPSVQMQMTPKDPLNAHAEGAYVDEQEMGELEKRISKRVTQARRWQQTEVKKANSDSEAEEDLGCGHTNGHASASRSGLDGRRPLWGNATSHADVLSRCGLFDREGSVASSVGGHSVNGPRSWLGHGYTPTGLEAASGSSLGLSNGGPPPEALRRILATRLESNRINGRARRRQRRLNGIDSDMDDSEVGEDLEEEDQEEADGEGKKSRHRHRDADDDSDEEEEEDENDDGGDAAAAGGRSTFTSSGGASGSRLGSKRSVPTPLTKMGRPRRRFFDGAAPYAYQRPPPVTVSTAAPPPPPPPPAAVVVAPPTTLLEATTSAAEEEAERERGRRGEGGGSEVDPEMLRSATAASAAASGGPLSSGELGLGLQVNGSGAGGTAVQDGGIEVEMKDA